ncbi:hypothetical protein GBAR_LOCUS18378 [Geodia barretti]|uniref:Uncharacterized protein n=1 Tax=Geodia barretti TaxID=519541 RepID=A0AA35SPH3_GEOBA|nr:hypothetical protein GBAR_LOCUS18378 [Geodia barretti]
MPVNFTFFPGFSTVLPSLFTTNFFFGLPAISLVGSLRHSVSVLSAVAAIFVFVPRPFCSELCILLAPAATNLYLRIWGHSYSFYIEVVYYEVALDTPFVPGCTHWPCCTLLEFVLHLVVVMETM